MGVPVTDILSLLETKLKKHDWFWSTSSNPEDQFKGKSNFDDIQRLITEAKKQGKQAEAYALVAKYQKIR